MSHSPPSAYPADFSGVTERSDEPATPGQIADMYHRYRFASELCAGRRVVEIACGTGQGLALLGRHAISVSGSDIDRGSVERARATYGERIPVELGSAGQMPFEDASADVLVLLEAIYYVPDVRSFFSECRRVLAPGGTLVISSTNPALFDFVPSAHSVRYYQARELAALMQDERFRPTLYGYSATGELPKRHRLLRPIKAALRRLGLIPKSMRGKALVRRLLFGPLLRMPRDLSAVDVAYQPPVALPLDRACRDFRYLYLVGERVS